MIGRILILLVWGLVSSVVFAQKVDIIKQFGGYLATDMVVSESGHIYICGNNNSHPILIKLDTNGNEKWIKQYPQNQPGYSFTRMILDSNENVYLHGTLIYTRKNNFVCKITDDGLLIWQKSGILGSFAGVDSNTPINLIIYDTTLNLIHNNRNMIGAPHDTTVLSQFNIHSGELVNYVEFTQMLDKHLHRNPPPPFKNGKWIFSGFSGVLELEPNGNYQYIELGDSIPGNLIGIDKNNKLYGFKNIIKWMNPSYPVLEPVISIFDESFKEIFKMNYWPDSLSHFPDSVSKGFVSIIPSEQKGLIGIGGFKKGITLRSAYFFQINPDNMKTVTDTILTGIEGVNIIASKNNNFFAFGQISPLSDMGVRVFKLNFPDIDHQTKFITSITPLFERKNSVQIELFPNPTNRTFKIESNHKIKTITIYNLSGKQIKHVELNSYSTQIAMETKGVFLLRIENTKGQINTEKIVIN